MITFDGLSIEISTTVRIASGGIRMSLSESVYFVVQLHHLYTYIANRRAEREKKMTEFWIMLTLNANRAKKGQSQPCPL